MARTLSFLLLIGFGSCLVGGPAPNPVDRTERSLAKATTRALAPKTVFLGCGLSDLDVITVTTSLAASGQPAELLLDSVAAAPQFRTFLSKFRPHRVVPIGSLREGKIKLDQRLGVSTAA